MKKFEELKTKTAEFAKSERGSRVIEGASIGMIATGSAVIGGTIGALVGTNAVLKVISKKQLQVVLTPEIVESIKQMA